MSKLTKTKLRKQLNELLKKDRDSKKQDIETILSSPDFVGRFGHELTDDNYSLAKAVMTALNKKGAWNWEPLTKEFKDTADYIYKWHV